MRTNFTTAVAYAALNLMASLSVAQLPQSCFMHGEQHGGYRTGHYESYLPMLELEYEPGMTLKSISGFLTEDGILNGLQLELADRTGSKSLTHQIGGSGSKIHTEQITGPMEALSIMYSNDYVCNVVLKVDGRTKSLSEDKSGACDIDKNSDIQLVVLKSEEDHPIVGFHGRTKDDKLLDLGLIWLDRLNPQCQETLPQDVQEQMVINPYLSADEAWQLLSEEDKKQGKDLEALLSYHEIAQSKKRQEDIYEKFDEAIDEMQQDRDYMLLQLQDNSENPDMSEADRQNLIDQIDENQKMIDNLLKVVTTEDATVEDLEKAMKKFNQFNQKLSVLVDKTMNDSVEDDGTSWYYNQTVIAKSYEPKADNQSEGIWITTKQLQDENKDLLAKQTRLQQKMDGVMYKFEFEASQEQNKLDPKDPASLMAHYERQNEEKKAKKAAQQNLDANQAQQELIAMLQNLDKSAEGVTRKQILDLSIDLVDDQGDFVQILAAGTSDEPDKEMKNFSEIQDQIDYLLILITEYSEEDYEIYDILLTMDQLDIEISNLKDWQEVQITKMENAVGNKFKKSMAIEEFEQTLLETDALLYLKKMSQNYVYRIDVEDYIQNLQDNKAITVENLYKSTQEPDRESETLAYLKQFSDTAFQLNYLIDFEKEMINSPNSYYDDVEQYSQELSDTFMDIEYDQELTPGNDQEILILMEELQEEIWLQEAKEDWLENNADEIAESMQFAIFDDQFLEEDLAETKELVRDMIKQQKTNQLAQSEIQITAPSNTNSSLKQVEEVSSDQKAEREKLISLLHNLFVFVIVLGLLFALACGCICAFIFSKWCGTKNNRSPITFNSRGDNIQSPDISPTFNSDRTPDSKRNFNLHVKKTGSYNDQ